MNCPPYGCLRWRTQNWTRDQYFSFRRGPVPGQERIRYPILVCAFMCSSVSAVFLRGMQTSKAIQKTSLIPTLGHCINASYWRQRTVDEMLKQQAHKRWIRERMWRIARWGDGLVFTKTTKNSCASVSITHYDRVPTTRARSNFWFPFCGQSRVDRSHWNTRIKSLA